MLVIQTVLSKVIWVASSSTDSWVSNGVREMNASSVRACSSSLLGRLGRFRQKLWLTKTGSMLTVSYLIVLKECLPVYPREYSMILNKNSASSTINSLQGLSGSSQSGWCCRNLSVFHMFFISGGSKSERISTPETTRKRRPKRPSGGYSFQYGRSWTGGERSCVIWQIPKTSKNIREKDFLLEF